jgi:chromosome segregation ATPase
MKENESELSLRLKRSESTSQELSNQLRESNQHKQELSQQCRDLSSQLRASESSKVELEGQLNRHQSKLFEAENNLHSMDIRYKEFEKEVVETRQLLSQSNAKALQLEQVNSENTKKLNSSLEAVKLKVMDLEDQNELLREEKEALAVKLSAVEISSKASVYACATCVDAHVFILLSDCL